MELPRSPIRQLMALSDETEARGTDIISLNIGQPDIPPPPAVVETLRRAAELPLTYTPSRGIPDVVNAWRDYYQALSIEVESSDIIVTSGASEAIQIALLATCDPGDEVLVPEPFYAPYTAIASLVGITVVPVPLAPGFQPPHVDAFRARVTARTRAILLCSPNNPTGTVFGYEDLAALASLAREMGLFVLSDETYREIVFDGPPAPSVLSLPELEDHAVVIDSMSKRFNVCGIRIGSLVSRNAEVTASALQLAELRLSVPVVEQIAAAAALREPSSYITETVVSAYRERRDVALAELRAMPGVVPHEPHGGFYIAARLPVDDAATFAAWLQRDVALYGAPVMLTPLSDFFATPGYGRDAVRIALVVEPNRLRQAMAILREALQQYPGRTA